MAQSFWMARLKVDRARTLINEVAVELDSYRADPPVEHRRGVGEDGYYIETEVKSGPVKTAPIIGDVIHNLRSSLDLTASELARINGKSDKNTYFPISDSEGSLDERIHSTKFHLAGDDAVELLKTFKPYRGGNAALRAIHDLDIRDKHTALIPTASLLGTRMIAPYRDGVLHPEEATVEIDPKSIKLKFPNDTAFAGDEVIPTLENLVDLVDGIVESFAALVAKRR